MSKIKCPEKDCAYVGETESGLRMHLRFKHNKRYDGGAIMQDNGPCLDSMERLFDDDTIVEITIKVKKR